MTTSMYLIAAAYILLVTGQLVASDDEGSEETSAPPGCPSLSPSGLRIVCTGPDGPRDCSSAEVGVKARVMWKKNVLPSGVGTDIVCKESGVWKSVRSSMAPPKQGDITTRQPTTTHSSGGMPKIPGMPAVTMPSIPAVALPAMPALPKLF